MTECSFLQQSLLRESVMRGEREQGGVKNSSAEVSLLKEIAGVTWASQFYLCPSSMEILCLVLTTVLCGRLCFFRGAY